MAMLAEYNTKKPRYNAVRAHTNANWAKETNSWGMKMLQKMGWSEGKGLGVDEAGTTEPLHIAYKSDVRGLGHSILEGDKAVAQQKDFDALLATLSQKDEETEKVAEVSEERTPKSLELMSQKSRARVHYRKFTRGKDLSRASSKDLASILGIGTDIIEKKLELDSVVPAVGPAIEIKLLKNSGSSVDYFKNLLDLKKKKTQLENADKVEIEEEKSSEDVTDEDDNSPSNNSILNGTLDRSSSTGRRKSVTWGDVEVSFVSKYIKDMVDTSTESVNEVSSDMLQDTESVEQSLENGCEKNKKKKKKRKNGLSEEAQDDTTSTNELPAEVDECAEQPKKKKKKNKKSKNETEVLENNGDSLDCSLSLESSVIDNSTPKKKKKKSKNKSEDLDESISTLETSEDKEATASLENNLSVKSKKKKLKQSDSNGDLSENLLEEPESKKGKKKRRLSEVEDSEIQVLEECIDLTSSKKKRKKHEDIVEKNTSEDTPTEGKKKKKQKSVEATLPENEVGASSNNSNENAAVESEKKKKKKKKHDH